MADQDHQSAQNMDMVQVRKLIGVAILGLVVAVGVVIATIVHVAIAADHDEFAREITRAKTALNYVETPWSRFTSAMAQQLGQQYGLDRAQVSAQTPVDAQRLYIEMPRRFGPEARYLSWMPVRPGQAAFFTFAPIRIPLLLIIFGLMGGLLAFLFRLAVALDLEKRKAIKLAGTDPLTGLANRLQFDEILTRRLANPCDSSTLFFLDLDGFKAVNDRFGHAAGDAVLQGVAARISQSVDTETLIARLGGDEFALLSGQDLDKPAAELLADQIVTSLERPFLLGDKTAAIGVSIGMARNDGRGFSAQTLMARADSALYRAKSQTGSARRFAHETRLASPLPATQLAS